MISYYEAALKVQRINGKIFLDDSDTQKCAGANSVSELKNGVETDLILLVTATQESSNYIASAGACFVDIATNWRLNKLTPLVLTEILDLMLDVLNSTLFMDSPMILNSTSSNKYIPHCTKSGISWDSLQAFMNYMFPLGLPISLA